MNNHHSMAEKLYEALTALGYSLVDAGEYDDALELSQDLEKAGIYSSYEIAAAAYAGKGDLHHAVRMLERGVKVDPDYWINWELLGSYRSELGDFAGADKAYLKGLQCPGAWMDSITYNRAVAKARSGDAQGALEVLDEVVDPYLDEPAAMVRTGLLVELERAEEALELINQCMQKEWGDHTEEVRGKFRQKRVWLLEYLNQGSSPGDGERGKPGR